MSEEEKIQKDASIIDMVEPKFKVGDWIVFNGLTLYIKKVVKGFYRTISKGGIPNSYDWDIDNVARLWTIQDAKDGDVLCYETENELSIFIYKNGHIHYHCCYYNGHLTTVDSFFVAEKYLLCYIHPATKEQRELLFAKMRDAGYVWDFDKKELRKIEDEEYNGEDYGIDSLFHAQRILEKTLGKVEGYQTDDGILSHKCAISAVNKLYKQKFAWDEEDERMFASLKTLLNNASCYSYTEGVDKILSWLKSLKPQPHWKPSNEQIGALNYAYCELFKREDVGNNILGPLQKLCDELKKL